MTQESKSYETEATNLLPARSLLSPPRGGAREGINAIFWNEHELRAGWRLLIYLVLAALFAAAGSFLTHWLHLPQVTRNNNTATSLLVQELVMTIAALAAASILALLEGRPFDFYGLPKLTAFGKLFWQGTVWGLAMISLIVLFIRLLGGISFGALALHGLAVWDYAVLWSVVFLFVGLFEEFLFRGYTQFTLASGLSFWPAATVLSALFGALHLGNSGEDKIGAVSVFLFGMLSCLTLRRTGNLWFAVGMHASFDWGETFLFSVPNSGLVVPGHLLSSSFHGPMWLTGGTVGPEGSAMLFVVLGLTAALFVRIYPAKPDEEQHFP